MQLVTNQMINNTMTYNLGRQQKEMDHVQNALATGKQVETPRDNPIATTNQMLYLSRMSEVDQYNKNIDEAKSYMDTSDTALQSVKPARVLV